MKCVAGDLAVILNDPYPENIGAFVKVTQRVTDTDAWYGYSGEEWECKPLQPIRGWVSDDKTQSTVGLEACALFDADLKPIRGKKAADKQLTINPPEEALA
ncbi:hypothetical protein [Rhodoferax fermentans]|uniref:Uncharacterized protein n=1 Tax=Rhodoferax fermentans TaxID=28066 RepID=A0A1T1ANT1_RHOFE|nr:hypothetical protein [Rhodoferax fermentans]OOV05782.1 hypothetical protein RF819_02820 [Rhodoferax fermentans]